MRRSLVPFTLNCGAGRGGRAGGGAGGAGRAGRGGRGRGARATTGNSSNGDWQLAAWRPKYQTHPGRAYGWPSKPAKAHCWQLYLKTWLKGAAKGQCKSQEDYG